MRYNVSINVNDVERKDYLRVMKAAATLMEEAQENGEELNIGLEFEKGFLTEKERLSITWSTDNQAILGEYIARLLTKVREKDDK